MGGVYVKSFSGLDRITEVSSIGNRSDIRHWVYMKNLIGYPLEIKCKGRIPAPNPVVKFSSERVGDTETFWTEGHPYLPDNQEYDFSHVTFVPTNLGVVGQEEIILTDFEVHCSQSGRKDNRTFNMKVSI